jgi:hypothetical protein
VALAGQTANFAFYIEVLSEGYHSTELDKKVKNCWILHHGNVPCHISLALWQFVVKKQIQAILHLLYSPGLTLCDFCPFASKKIENNGHHFASIEKIQQEVTGLADIPKEVFHRYFQQWHISWIMHVMQKGSSWRLFRLGFIHVLITVNCVYR